MRVLNFIKSGGSWTTGQPTRPGTCGKISPSAFDAADPNLQRLTERIMIPASIAKTHIVEAIQRIIRDGVPPRRRGRGYCLVTNGEHLPPKYTIALAHQVATGEGLRSDRFSGGPESNEFLRCRGFDVAKCDCGGSVHDDRVGSMPGPWMSEKEADDRIEAPHSERCADCKIRVASFLERIYGICVPNHRFRWQAGLAPYAATSIGSVLRDVAQRLEAHRDSASTSSYEATCWRGVITGFPIPDSSSSSMKTSTSRARGSSRSLRVRGDGLLGVLRKSLDGALRTSRRKGQQPSGPRRTTSLVRHTAGPDPVDQGFAADSEALCARSGLVLARSGQERGQGTFLGPAPWRAFGWKKNDDGNPIRRCST